MKVAIHTLVGQSVRVTTTLGKVIHLHDVHSNCHGHIVGYRDEDGAQVHIGWTDMGSCTPTWISTIESTVT
jgi:hypothetical protein